MSIESDLVEDAISTPGDRWFAGLAGPLANGRWRSITAATGIDRESYGTMRYLAGDRRIARDELASMDLPAAFRASVPLPVETLHGETRRRYAELGLDFHSVEEADAGLVRTRLAGALERIAKVPGAAMAIGAVMAAMHVVRPEGPDYDVSYSDPEVPFSVFLGVAGGGSPIGDLRLAEGILHECMHLQLTLIEGVLPMAEGMDERLHSPWQGTMRPIQGILHGLYVFRVIQDFHCALIACDGLPGDERAYLERRIDQIEQEAADVGDLAHCRELTPAGHRLTARLLAA